jgi:hypothetical protein
MKKTIFFFCVSVIFFFSLMPMDPLPDQSVPDQEMLVEKERALKSELVLLMNKAFELCQQGLVDYVFMSVYPLHGIVSFVCGDGRVKVFLNHEEWFYVKDGEMVQKSIGNLWDGFE